MFKVVKGLNWGSDLWQCSNGKASLLCYRPEKYYIQTWHIDWNLHSICI